MKVLRRVRDVNVQMLVLHAVYVCELGSYPFASVLDSAGHRRRLDLWWSDPSSYFPNFSLLCDIHLPHYFRSHIRSYIRLYVHAYLRSNVHYCPHVCSCIYWIVFRIILDQHDVTGSHCSRGRFSWHISDHSWRDPG